MDDTPSTNAPERKSVLRPVLWAVFAVLLFVGVIYTFLLAAL